MRVSNFVNIWSTNAYEKKNHEPVGVLNIFTFFFLTFVEQHLYRRFNWIYTQ